MRPHGSAPRASRVFAPSDRAGSARTRVDGPPRCARRGCALPRLRPDPRAPSLPLNASLSLPPYLSRHARRDGRLTSLPAPPLACGMAGFLLGCVTPPSPQLLFSLPVQISVLVVLFPCPSSSSSWLGLGRGRHRRTLRAAPGAGEVPGPAVLHQRHEEDQVGEEGEDNHKQQEEEATESRRHHQQQQKETKESRHHQHQQQGCDLYQGRWAYDAAGEHSSLYRESECEFLTEQFTCMRNGRRDDSYQKWRW